jgi:hypothetical protein
MYCISVSLDEHTKRRNDDEKNIMCFATKTMDSATSDAGPPPPLTARVIPENYFPEGKISVAGAEARSLSLLGTSCTYSSPG